MIVNSVIAVLFKKWPDRGPLSPKALKKKQARPATARKTRNEASDIAKKRAESHSAGDDLSEEPETSLSCATRQISGYSQLSYVKSRTSKLVSDECHHV